MVRTRRPGWAGVVLASFALWAAVPLSAQEEPESDDQAPSQSAPDEGLSSQAAAKVLGEDLIKPFVPEHPRTAQDRVKIEALRDYVTARALEDRKCWSQAIDLLEEAHKKDPDSVAILRRLSRLSFHLGRTDQAVEYARKVIAADPGDTTTMTLLMAYFEQKNDPAGAETLLKEALANPKLDPKSPGYVLIQRDLGELYQDQLNQPGKAAEAFTKVMEALDQREANALSPVDQQLILGGDEAETYAKFGQVFYNTRHYDLAVRAFQHAIVYDSENSQLPRFLAMSQIKADQPEAALTTLEALIDSRPNEREPYLLLDEALKAVKRESEFVPRLEKVLKANPENSTVKYILADRYREAGETEKADTLLASIQNQQPDPDGVGARTRRLLEEKKYDELVQLLGQAFTKPDTLEAVKPQIEAIVNHPETVDAVLEAGLALQKAEPPKLSRESRLILRYIAEKAKKVDKFLDIQRLALQQEPNAQAYMEVANDLAELNRYSDAADTLKELLEKFPEQRQEGRLLDELGRMYLLSGQYKEALETCREAEKLDPTDIVAGLYIGSALGRLGKNEEAIEHYNKMLEQFADNEEVVRRVRSGLSVAYVNMDQFDKGEHELEILLEEDPDDPGINNDLGYLYADRGKNLDQAEMMIRKAVEEEPDNSSYLDSLGWVLFKKGKVAEAIEYLERASQGSTATLDPTIFDHLGDAYFKLKELPKARESWKKAEGIASGSQPPDPRLEEIRKKLETLKSLDESLPDAASNPARP